MVLFSADRNERLHVGENKFQKMNIPLAKSSGFLVKCLASQFKVKNSGAKSN